MPKFGTRSLNGGERVWKLAGANLVVRVGGDPIAPFLPANRGEDADIAGDQEAQRITVCRIRPTSVTTAIRAHCGRGSIATWRSSQAAPGNRELSS